jgi:hypothetical protein
VHSTCYCAWSLLRVNLLSGRSGRSYPSIWKNPWSQCTVRSLDCVWTRTSSSSGVSTMSRLLGLRWVTLFHRSSQTFSWDTKKLKRKKFSPKVWVKYINDVYEVLYKDNLENLPGLLSRQYDSIKFINEIEKSLSMRLIHCRSWMRTETRQRRRAALRGLPRTHHQPATQRVQSFSSTKDGSF